MVEKNQFSAVPYNEEEHVDAFLLAPNEGVSSSEVPPATAFGSGCQLNKSAEMHGICGDQVSDLFLTHDLLCLFHFDCCFANSFIWKSSYDRNFGAIKFARRI